MSKILFDDDYVIVIPSFSEVLPHKHSFYHIFFLADVSATSTGKVSRAYVVGSNTRHKMPPLSECKLFLMIDPTSDVAERINREILTDKKDKIIELSDGLDILEKNYTDSELIQSVKNCLLHNNFKTNLKSNLNDNDYRMVKLLKEIKEFKHLEKSIQEIADRFGISDSRLSHAFKENMGVSLKGYLNIKQMQYAYKLIMEGESITNASLEAGFSNPAHLAATCKKQMGISVSMVLKH